MRYFDAGALRFGVEYRPRPRVARRDLQGPSRGARGDAEAVAEGGFADEGVTVHGFDATDGHEYLRFDMFDDEPHYHYIPKTTDGSIVNNVLDFDVPAHGDMLPWVFQSLRTRLPMMLEHAGGGTLAQKIDDAALAGARRRDVLHPSPGAHEPVIRSVVIVSCDTTSGRGSRRPPRLLPAAVPRRLRRVHPRWSRTRQPKPHGRRSHPDQGHYDAAPLRI